MKKIYLDYAAATPLDNRVLGAMEPYFSKSFHNPSAIYLAGREARQALEAARLRLASSVGAKPAEIIFTSGATEANNLAIQGVMRQYPSSNLLVSVVEHESVLAPSQLFKARQMPVNHQGLVDPAKLAAAVNDKTVLVSVMLVNNEIGSIQPLTEIAAQLAKTRAARQKRGNQLPLLLHSDAAQAANYLDLHVSRLGVDLMTVNGGKIYGPKQSGFLYVRAGTKLQPLILGGGQEFGLRSGTENLAAIIGLAEAFELAQSSRQAESRRLGKLRDEFIKNLRAKFPEVIVNGGDKQQAPHIVNVSFPRVDGERLMMQLDELGVEVAVGSACSASQAEPSHVLKAIGLSDDLARSSLRFSFGRPTSSADLTRTLNALTQIIRGVIP